MASPRHTLSADERLKREQSIETLFLSGKAFSVYPIRTVWHLSDRPATEPFSIRCGFSAAKKKFKKATQRNRVKRLLREAWRLQKGTLPDAVPAGKQLQVFLLCTATEIPEWPVVQEAVGKCIARLGAALQEPPAQPTPPSAV